MNIFEQYLDKIKKKVIKQDLNWKHILKKNLKNF